MLTVCIEYRIHFTNTRTLIISTKVLLFGCQNTFLTFIPTLHPRRNIAYRAQNVRFWPQQSSWSTACLAESKSKTIRFFFSPVTCKTRIAVFRGGRLARRINQTRVGRRLNAVPRSQREGRRSLGRLKRGSRTSLVKCALPMQRPLLRSGAETVV